MKGTTTIRPSDSQLSSATRGNGQEQSGYKQRKSGEETVAAARQKQ